MFSVIAHRLHSFFRLRRSTSDVMMRLSRRNPTMLTRQIGRLIPIALLLTLGVLASLPDPATVWTVAAAQDLDYDDEFTKGRDLYRRGKFEDALKSFKRANELRDKKSAECYGWMSETYIELHSFPTRRSTALVNTNTTDGRRVPYL